MLGHWLNVRPLLYERTFVDRVMEVWIRLLPRLVNWQNHVHCIKFCLQCRVITFLPRQTSWLLMSVTTTTVRDAPFPKVVFFNWTSCGFVSERNGKRENGRGSNRWVVRGTKILFFGYLIKCDSTFLDYSVDTLSLFRYSVVFLRIITLNPLRTRLFPPLLE